MRARYPPAIAPPAAKSIAMVGLLFPRPLIGGAHKVIFLAPR
jgi:hypothetical protein